MLLPFWLLLCWRLACLLALLPGVVSELPPETSRSMLYICCCDAGCMHNWVALRFNMLMLLNFLYAEGVHISGVIVLIVVWWRCCVHAQPLHSALQQCRVGALCSGSASSLALCCFLFYLLWRCLCARTTSSLCTSTVSCLSFMQRFFAFAGTLLLLSLFVVAVLMHAQLVRSALQQCRAEALCSGSTSSLALCCFLFYLLWRCGGHAQPLCCALHQCRVGALCSGSASSLALCCFLFYLLWRCLCTHNLFALHFNSDVPELSAVVFRLRWHSAASHSICCCDAECTHNLFALHFNSVVPELSAADFCLRWHSAASHSICCGDAECTHNLFALHFNSVVPELSAVDFRLRWHSAASYSICCGDAECTHNLFALHFNSVVPELSAADFRLRWHSAASHSICYGDADARTTCSLCTSTVSCLSFLQWIFRLRWHSAASYSICCGDADARTTCSLCTSTVSCRSFLQRIFAFAGTLLLLILFVVAMLMHAQLVRSALQQCRA